MTVATAPSLALGEAEEASSSSKSTKSTEESFWKKMDIETATKPASSIQTTDACLTSKCQAFCRILRRRWLLCFLCLALLGVIAGAAIAICVVFANAQEQSIRSETLALAQETGEWFSDQLDRAILPLFSLGQFATELEHFRDLPQKIGPVGEPGSLPLLPPKKAGGPITHRNVTGVCDEPTLVEHFIQIASTLKKNAQMEGILVNVQLAPQAVICLLHPMNNTQDFEDGKFLDSTGAWGLDLFTDPFMSAIAQESMKSEDLSIVGPRKLVQCPECEQFFIVRLPIAFSGYEIEVDGTKYPRWGFATALIDWSKLVNRSSIYETFEQRGLEFKLTRTDRNYNEETDSYDTNIVVLAETPNYANSNQGKTVSTELQTTNNLWEISIAYNSRATAWLAWTIPICIIVAMLISFLLCMVVLQKQIQHELKGKALAQNAKVETERNMTAYFAHELRNPLGAIDSALVAMPESESPEAKELVASMKLCTTFMSQIMNNLLDVRKMEENKLVLRSDPFSLPELVEGVHKMLQPSVKKGVEFTFSCHTNGRDYASGDFYRIQQVYTNVVTNAIKHTSSGSIDLSLRLSGDIIRFECRDTGPGIPKEEQKEMFERFHQRGGVPGSGLGLYIAKQLVDLMDGSIRFESDPATKPGTTCIVDISLQACPPPIEAAVEEVEPQLFEEKMRFLIVDDIKMNRAMLRRRICKGVAPNAVIQEAATGEEALEILSSGNEERFDVIIVDQFMEQAGGVLKGTQAVERMRAMKIDSVIVGNSGNDLEDEFGNAGVDLFWKKPLPSNEEMLKQLQSKVSYA